MTLQVALRPCKNTSRARVKLGQTLIVIIKLDNSNLPPCRFIVTGSEDKGEDTQNPPRFVRKEQKGSERIAAECQVIFFRALIILRDFIDQLWTPYSLTIP